MFGIGIVSFVKRKKIWLASWCGLSLAGYIALMGITYCDLPGDALLFHIESEWESIGVIMAVPFIFSFLPRLKTTNGLAVLSVIFIIRLTYIGISSEKFSWRTDLTRTVLAKMRAKGITKLGLVNDGELMQKCMLTWGLPDESILMSTMKGDNPQLTFEFVDTNDKQLMSSLSNPKLVNASMEMVIPGNWNFEYFKPDTLRPYTIMTYGELMSDSTSHVQK